MTRPQIAYTATGVFDGEHLHTDSALLVEAGRVVAIVARKDIPLAAQVIAQESGWIVPGFVDLQVNGGGGVMFGDDPSVETLRVMAEAHAKLGALTILPTLITDTGKATMAAVAQVEAAIKDGVAGIAGLHLEGPHLSQSRKGAHDPDLIRPMGADDLAFLSDAARRMPVLKITLAPESVSLNQMRALSDAGAILSLGHTDAGFDQCLAAADAGVTCVTHLFNAMRQLGSREPGVVGAALTHGAFSAGMIGDLYHVHPDTIRLALAAKQGPGQVFLVSDAMAVAGSDLQCFALNGRTVLRKDGRLTLSDGTLAGADLDMATAIRNLCAIGVPMEQALAMATSRPANVIGIAARAGGLAPGRRADFLHLDNGLDLRGVWRNGAPVTISQAAER